MSDLPPHAEDDALAAEWVLGVLEHEERATVARRLIEDSAFALRVTAWENRLSPLNDAYDPAPAPEIFGKIEARLFPKPDRRPIWRAWLLGAVYATIAAVGVAVFVFLNQPDVLLVAELTATETGLAYEARFDGETMIVERLSGAAAPAGKVHELWIIAPGAAPVSLGLLDQAALRVAYPLPPKGWVLAITLEPAGGGPGGNPSGPILASTEIGA